MITNHSSYGPDGYPDAKPLMATDLWHKSRPAPGVQPLGGKIAKPVSQPWWISSTGQQKGITKVGLSTPNESAQRWFRWIGTAGNYCFHQSLIYI